MTYQELFLKLKNKAEKAKKEDSATKLLFLELVGFSYSDYILNYDHLVPLEILDKIEKTFEKYLNNNFPVQYILGYTYFYGIKLIVNPSVLIPRQETEILVELIINYLRNKPTVKLLDIGCGSGSISLALKKSLPNLDITAIDISEEALNVAKENALNNNLNIKFLKSNLFENVQETYDVIVSNPPYLAGKEEADKLVQENEPDLALYAQENGLYFYRKIIREALTYINKPGVLFFEIPSNKQNELDQILLESIKQNKYLYKKDLNGLDRVLIIEFD